MPDQLAKEPATNIVAALEGRPDLSLRETSLAGLWSIQSSRAFKLDSFASAVFRRHSAMGTMLKADGIRLIQLWPDRAYLLCEQLKLPDRAVEFESMATDISHAICQLLLSGSDSLPFLNAYTTVDLQDQAILSTACLRTRLGQYSITLWWERPAEIHILVDRSYAQSLADYLQALSTRWF